MDRRQKKTRAAIFEAFEHLLTQQSYNKITVQEIIDGADVGRSTFYSHFETKDALLKELCTELFGHVFSSHPEVEHTHDFSLANGDSKSTITHILYHLRDGGPTLSRLLTGESADIFLDYFKQYLNELATRCLSAKELEHHASKVPADFLQNHISSSFVNMVQWWFRGGMKESPEELTAYFMAVIEPIL